MSFPKLRGIRGDVYPNDIDSCIKDQGNGEDIIGLFDRSARVHTGSNALTKIGEVIVTKKVMFWYYDGCLVVVRRSDKMTFNFKLSDSANEYLYCLRNDQKFDFMKNRILYVESSIPVSSQIQTEVEVALAPVLDDMQAGFRGEIGRTQASLHAEIERQRLDMERERAAIKAQIERDMHEQAMSTTVALGRSNETAMHMFREIQESTSQLVKNAQASTIQTVEKKTAEAKNHAMYWAIACGSIMCIVLFVVIVAFGVAVWWMITNINNIDGRVTSNADETKAITSGLAQQTSGLAQQTSGLAQQTYATDQKVGMMLQGMAASQLAKTDNPPQITCTQTSRDDFVEMQEEEIQDEDMAAENTKTSAKNKKASAKNTKASAKNKKTKDNTTAEAYSWMDMAKNVLCFVGVILLLAKAWCEFVNPQ